MAQGMGRLREYDEYLMRRRRNLDRFSERLGNPPDFVRNRGRSRRPRGTDRDFVDDMLKKYRSYAFLQSQMDRFTPGRSQFMRPKLLFGKQVETFTKDLKNNVKNLESFTNATLYTRR